MADWVNNNFRRSHQAKVLVRVSRIGDSGSIQTSSCGVEVAALHFNTTIFGMVQIVDHDRSRTEKFNDFDHLLVGGETDTDMGIILVCDLSHLLLELK